MPSHDNMTGRPLADGSWLEAHHRAKLQERTAFVERLVALEPRRVVDLGCATGLWLALLHEHLPLDCEFIGIDGDQAALKLATARASSWRREVRFVNLDLEIDAAQVPAADLTLAFNVFSYIENLEMFLETLAQRTPRGVLAIRQYDGASIRFGPMRTEDRQRIESALRVSVSDSARFRHYDLDRAFTVLRQSRYSRGDYEFELFARSSPFPDDFLGYYTGTLEWTRGLLSPAAAERLDTWIAQGEGASGRYFFEVDLVGLLS